MSFNESFQTIQTFLLLCAECFCQKPQPHGNSKKTTNEYVRTSCTVKRKLDEMTETNKALAPRDIYEHMVLNGSDCGPRDLKQVQNAKYHNKKQKTNNKLYYIKQ